MEGGTLRPLFSWRAAICDSDLSSTTRHVALTLSLHMNERGSSAWPGPTRLARETGLNVSTVKERLRELERTGWLRCVSRGGLKGETRRANEYEAALPEPALFPQPGAVGTRCPEDPVPSASLPGAVGTPSTSMSTSRDIRAELELQDEPRPDPVLAVFSLWTELGHTRAHLDRKRRARITWALDHYPLDDVLDAIRGAHASPWHQGENPAGKKYDELSTTLRDAEHLEAHRDQWRSPPVGARARSDQGSNEHGTALGRSEGAPPLWLIGEDGSARRSY